VIVIDASVVVDVLLGGPSPAGDALAAVLARDEPVGAPHLLDVEVGQVLRRFVVRGQLAEAVAEELLGELVASPISRYEHRGLLTEPAGTSPDGARSWTASRDRSGPR